MEPLDGAVVVVARDHLAERNAAADAVQRLIRIDFNVKICNIRGFLLAAATNFGAAMVAAQLVQALFKLGVGCKFLFEASQI